MTNYNKVKDCPELLEKWLELINSVPLGSDNYLPTWDMFLSNAYFELTGEALELIRPLPPELDYGDREPMTYEQQEALVESYDKAIATLKEKTVRFPILNTYLFEPKDQSTPKNIYDDIRFTAAKYQYEKSAYLRFQTFQQMRFDLRTIAESCMHYQKTGRFSDFKALFKLRFKGEYKGGYDSNFVIKNGIIDYESDLISATRGISAERLKICPICDDVYWAKKTNAKTCGKVKCVNDLQNQKKKAKREQSK